MSVVVEQAREALAAAHYNLEGGFLTTAVNRAYYAAFHMARAALLLKGEAPRTHKGVHVRFRLHFVQTGRIGPEVAATLARAAEMREEADYDDGALIEADATEALIRDVARFLAAVEPLLTDDPNP
jgi:uncharacterized protein (UPF0332 family)